MCLIGSRFSNYPEGGSMFKNILLGFIVLTIGFRQQVPLETKPYNIQQAEFALQQLSDQIESMDEATLRILIRLRLATFLWNKLNADTQPSHRVGNSQSARRELPNGSTDHERRTHGRSPVLSTTRLCLFTRRYESGFAATRMIILFCPSNKAAPDR